MVNQYNFKNIRALFVNGFSEGELTTFIFDEPDFQDVYNELPPNASINEIVRRLLNYAKRKSLVEYLLTWAKEHNPAMYEKYQPYHGITIIATTSSITHEKSQRAQISSFQLWSGLVAGMVITLILVVIGVKMGLLFSPSPLTPTVSFFPKATITILPPTMLLPTATRRVVVDATPPPTFTAVPVGMDPANSGVVDNATPLPTPPPISTQTSVVTPTSPLTGPTEVELLSPLKKVLPNGQKNVIFEWQYGDTCESLPSNTGFLLRVWRDDLSPLGAMNAVTQQAEIQCKEGKYTFEVGNLQAAAGVAGATTGKFYWDVLLVNLDPYAEISAVTAAYFELAGTGGGSGGSGGGGSGGGGID